MAMRMLEVTPISAEDLKDVKLFGKMQTYVVAWVDPSRKASTNLDKIGGKNPRWNETLRLAIDERLLEHPNAILVLEIYSKGFMDSKLVGRVNVPLQDISAKSSGDAPQSYKVKRPSGRFQGTLHVGLKLGERIEQPAANSSSSAPVMAYPATGYPPQQGSYPPQQGSYAPQQNQGFYPPQQQYYPQAGGAYGYGGYPPVPPRRPRYGMGGGGLGGAGLGLGAGLLGGMLIGDMISDHDYYDGGYGDGGYGGDYGGGDFGGGDFGGDF